MSVHSALLSKSWYVSDKNIITTILFPFFLSIVDKSKRVCHYQELIDCVSKYTHFLIEFHAENQQNYHCYCEQNCIYSNIFIDFYRVLTGSTDLLGTIGGLAIVNQYPLIRYKRKILFSLNDLFGEFIFHAIRQIFKLCHYGCIIPVSIGGTASFFTGICVLGVIEIAYSFTLRLFWHIYGKSLDHKRTGKA